MQEYIRPFTPGDYPAVVGVIGAAVPQVPFTEEELRFFDQNRDSRCLNARWVAEVDGQLVGLCEHYQVPGRYHPHKFEIEVYVHPDRQGRGIGGRLYRHLMGALAAHDPMVAHTTINEHAGRALRFFADRGFTEVMRTWESLLEVPGFDPAPYRDLAGQVQAQGIAIRSLADLAADPDRDRKLYELVSGLRRDVPATTPATEMTFAQWSDYTFGEPGFLAEAYFVAVDGGAYVGLSHLRRQDDPTMLRTGLTAVRRAYRRRGIALALKLEGIEYARAHGYRTIRTFNESNNRPMLSINEQLGFVKQPAWIHVSKTLRPEA